MTILHKGFHLSITFNEHEAQTLVDDGIRSTTPLCLITVTHKGTSNL